MVVGRGYRWVGKDIGSCGGGEGDRRWLGRGVVGKEIGGGGGNGIKVKIVPWEGLMVRAKKVYIGYVVISEGWVEDR